MGSNDDKMPVVKSDVSAGTTKGHKIHSKRVEKL